MCILILICFSFSGHQKNKREWYPRGGFSSEPQSHLSHQNYGGSPLTGSLEKSSRTWPTNLNVAPYYSTWLAKVGAANHLLVPTKIEVLVETVQETRSITGWPPIVLDKSQWTHYLPVLSRHTRTLTVEQHPSQGSHSNSHFLLCPTSGHRYSIYTASCSTAQRRYRAYSAQTHIGSY
jgi:hypothetical protein